MTWRLMIQVATIFHFLLGKIMKLFVPKNNKVPAKNIIKFVPSPKRIRRDTQKPIDAFLKFINLDLIDIIVDCTNIFIGSKEQ